ncbi:TRAP transporter substrate-binding protein DctP [Marinomonas sp. RSW2]|uniref:TRAP transporter substrate-binding protein DctP n=1 Tax=Marinomonas maritima TaxID=2940935 RepID=A0ABT5WFH9_9GAMM|nr:TRAP transporter substrate-binding protein DctP [Marinomonas maritima]MDE8602790.1 TRAP transporter substrate-binding protein DctP [Marinomonas maritima]
MVKYFVLKRLSLVCIVVASSVASAQDWVMPTPFGDRNQPTQIAYEFAEDVQALTNGEVNILVKSNGHALPHFAIPGAVMTGKVVIGEFLLGLLDKRNSVFQHDMIPFLADNYDDAQLLWQVSKADTQKQLHKLGLHYLYVVPWTPYSVFSTRKIESIGDFSRLSIRAFNQTVTTLIQSLGANPVQVPLKEVKSAFEQGKLDGRFASLSVGEDSQVWTYAPYLNDLRIWIPKEIVVMNKNAFDKLDEKTKAAIEKASLKAERNGWLQTKERVETDLASLKNGGIIYSKPSNKLLRELEVINQRMTQEWINHDPKQNGSIYRAFREAQRQSKSIK